MPGSARYMWHVKAATAVEAMVWLSNELRQCSWAVAIDGCLSRQGRPWLCWNPCSCWVPGDFITNRHLRRPHAQEQPGRNENNQLRPAHSRPGSRTRQNLKSPLCPLKDIFSIVGPWVSDPMMLEVETGNGSHQQLCLRGSGSTIGGRRETCLWHFAHHLHGAFQQAGLA